MDIQSMLGDKTIQTDCKRTMHTNTCFLVVHIALWLRDSIDMFQQVKLFKPGALTPSSMAGTPALRNSWEEVQEQRPETFVLSHRFDYYYHWYY